ncbi:MAG: type 4a pilus biogenesis protein PilO [Candidatus Riflebacteria bacterium]|nr:type 4a pilus biogenesis protein PilO [Candidatus Riflebacteria bacterium]
MFIIIALVIVLMFFGVSGVLVHQKLYEPAKNEKTKLEGEINVEKQNITVAKKARDELPNLEARIDALREELEKKKRPTVQVEMVIPKVLASIEAIAKMFDVEFKDIRIAPIMREDSWSEFPVEIVINGQFKNIFNFLYIMEQRGLVTMSSGSINISRAGGPKDAKADDSPFLNVNITAKIVVR